jgi:hypothetical protein
VELFSFIQSKNNYNNDNHAYCRIVYFNVLTQQPEVNYRYSKGISEKIHEVTNHKHQHIKKIGHKSRNKTNFNTNNENN